MLYKASLVREGFPLDFGAWLWGQDFTQDTCVSSEITCTDQTYSKQLSANYTFWGQQFGEWHVHILLAILLYVKTSVKKFDILWIYMMSS